MDLGHVIEETRSEAAAERTEAILALEDAQQALDFARVNLAVAEGLLQSAHIVEKATKAKQTKAPFFVDPYQLTMAADAVVACRQAVKTSRAERTLVEQRLRRLDNVLKELDACATRIR